MTFLPSFTSLKRSKGVKKRRSKPRPGRLKGKALEELRRDCFERDGYKCQALERIVIFPNGTQAEIRCWKRVTWESGHMAHIVSRGRGGKDELSNVTTKCQECHIVREHSYGKSGVKPCPPKPISSKEGRA